MVRGSVEEATAFWIGKLVEHDIHQSHGFLDAPFLEVGFVQADERIGEATA